MSMVWLSGSSSPAAYTSGTGMTAIVLNVPAGGRMVKWIYRCYAAGWAKASTDIGNLTPMVHTSTITINSTQYPSRMIYDARKLLLWEITWQTNNASTHIMHGAGENELGDKGECSYGGLGKGAITVTHGGNISGIRPGADLVNIPHARNLRVLYEI
jgi:hypothetical protein